MAALPVQQRDHAATAATVPPLAPNWVPAGGWTDTEIHRFLKREALFIRRGVGEQTEALAARLQRRDRERDERRMCLECQHLQRDGGCFAARQGLLHGAPANLTPIQTILQRCDGYRGALG